MFLMDVGMSEVRPCLEPSGSPSSNPLETPAALSPAHGLTSGLTSDDLHQLFEQNMEYLRGVLRGYVSRSGLAAGAEVDEVALEVLSETFLQAERSRHSFDASRALPIAWVQGVASNIIKGRLRQKARMRETQLSDQAHDDEARSDEEQFDHLARIAGQGREASVEMRVEAEADLRELMALVSPDDALVLQLSFEEDLDGVAVAQRLGVSHAAARQRQCRALSRLKREVHRAGRRADFAP